MSALIKPHLSDDDYADLLLENLIRQSANLAQFCFENGLNIRGSQAVTACGWLKQFRRQIVIDEIDAQDKSRAERLRSA